MKHIGLLYQNRISSWRNTLTVKESTWMKNFESKTLNKTFDKVMFADLENGKKLFMALIMFMEFMGKNE